MKYWQQYSAAKIAFVRKGENLIPKDAYKVAVSKVSLQLDPKGGLKQSAFDKAPESIQKLHSSLQTAIEERGKSDTLIKFSEFMSEKKKLPNELQPLKKFLDSEKGGFKKAVYDNFKDFPGFKEAAEKMKQVKVEILADAKKTPAKKAAVKREREPSI